MIEIRTANPNDLTCLQDMYQKTGRKPDGYFEVCLEKQADGALDIFIAALEGEEAGFCLFNRMPKYSLYRKLEIPEIQDLTVIPAARRQGVATALIDFCERRAMDQGCAQVGVSVGLTRDYGAAQILYARLGYVPDGNGATYDREGVRHGEMRPVDDDLCLMLVKALKAL